MSIIDTLKDRRKAEKSALTALSERIATAPAAEARTMTAKFNSGMVDIDTLDARIAELTEQDVRESAAASARVGNGGARFTTHGPQVYSDPHQNPESPSFFRDLRDSRLGNYEAADRLNRNQQARASESRAISTTAGAGGQFAPPAWLVDEFVAMARAGRVTADLLNKQELPSGVSSVNLPKVATGSTTAIQATQNTAISNTDITSTSVASGISTVAGQQVVSLQLIAQSGIPFDRIILEDLAFDYARALDLQVITGSGASGQLRGLENGASVGTTTFTSASPAFVSTAAANSLYNKIISAINTINTTRFLPPTAIVMHPTLWAWILEALDTTTRPLVLTSGASFQNAAGLSDGVVAQGAVGSLLGLPVYTDANIPTNKGAGTNQTEVYVLRGSDVYLYESALEMTSFEATYAAQASVLFRVLGYSAMIPDRYAQSVNIVSGTGLILPTL
jgi:HK97 family phage major capsid protein